MHELGHVFGLDHAGSDDPSSGGVMHDSLPLGIRRLPMAAEIDLLLARDDLSGLAESAIR